MLNLLFSRLWLIRLVDPTIARIRKCHLLELFGKASPPSLVFLQNKKYSVTSNYWWKNLRISFGQCSCFIMNPTCIGLDSKLSLLHSLQIVSYYWSYEWLNGTSRVLYCLTISLDTSFSFENNHPSGKFLVSLDVF